METLFIISISILAIANGSILTLPLVEKTQLATRIAIGAVIGFAGLSWIAFLTGLALGLNPISIGLTVAIVAICLGIQIRIFGRDKIVGALRDFEISLAGATYYITWTALLVWLFARVVMFYPDGLHTAPANNYGDLPFHFSAITSFAYGDNLPPQTPIYAGMKFTYPFLIDYLTAFFIRCGADWRSAFFVENIALALALVRLIEILTLKIFNNTMAARLAPVIFLFNGGLGFINFFREFGAQSNSLFDFLWHLPKTFTISDSGLALGSSVVPLRWGNVFTTLLIPQRSMLFGLPIVAMIITLWWMAVEEMKRRGDGGTGEIDPNIPHRFFNLSPSRRYLFAGGILAGFLPMLHAHGFFSVMIASAPLFLLFRSIDWVAFFAPVAVLAAPQAWYLSGTEVRNELFKPLDGWWESGTTNPLLFWGVNAGIFILLLLASLLIRKITVSRQALFYLPFVLWFLIPNLLSLAPWKWDNIKVLVYWSLVSAPFAAMALAFLFTRRLILARGLAIVLLLGLTFSGALDVTRALSPAENLGVFGQAELEVAALIREKTPPRAKILHAPIHNSVVALTGRQSVMGYPGHLWTHGINYAQRELDVKTIYQGGPKMFDTISNLGVDYVIIGPPERMQMELDEAQFVNNYPVVIDHAGFKVYQVRN